MDFGVMATHRNYKCHIKTKCLPKTTETISLQFYFHGLETLWVEHGERFL